MRYVTFYMSICAAFCCQFLSIPLFAQQQKVDTTHTYFIPEVTVSDIYQTREVRSTAPLQLFSKEALKNLHALQVSDAVKHFAGVTVKDYGGIGGLKTVSIRSLGAQHTAVGYDGIAITDCQTGQIDISRFSLDNVDQLSLSNGQSDNIFQPARFFASAGILDIQTLTPRFEKGKRTNISAAFKTGSWGLVNPSILLEQQLSPQWTVSANGEWMSSDGQYPYTLRYGNAADDLTSREKRKNTDVETFRAETGLYGNFSDKEQWRLKAYYFQSSRGLPKATTLYNDFSAQHLWDKNTFIQSQYKKEFSRQWVFRTSAKWNWSYQHYLDPAIKNNEGKTENSYYQQEYYLSASVLYRLLNNLSFSLSTDGSINTMNANMADFAHPTRYSWLTAIAGKYVNEWFTLSASALATASSAFFCASSIAFSASAFSLSALSFSSLADFSTAAFLLSASFAASRFVFASSMFLASPVVCVSDVALLSASAAIAILTGAATDVASIAPAAAAVVIFVTVFLLINNTSVYFCFPLMSLLYTFQKTFIFLGRKISHLLLI